MSSGDLEKRVQALEDIEAIKQLHQLYMTYHDDMEFEKIMDLLTDDAEVEVRQSGVKKGKKEYEEIFIGFLAARRRARPRHEGHIVTHPMIEADGNKAKGTWLVVMLFSVPTVEWIEGKQTCEYTKINGVWKISKLKFARTFASKKELYP